MHSDKLRERAAHFRLIALEGTDIHLVELLRQLAADFDAEATAIVQQGECQTAATLRIAKDLT